MAQAITLNAPLTNGRLAGRVGAWLGAAALVLLVTIVYLPTLDNGFFYDDRIDIQENLSMRSLAGLEDIWFKFGTFEQYYPLMYSTHWIEYQLWGPNPRGYHAVNFLLHAASAVLAWRLLARVAVPGAWLAAAIFAVHPVGVESAAWITERRNVLSCALAIGAILAYLRFAPPEEVPARSNRAFAPLQPQASSLSSTFLLHPSSFYLLALVLYIAALLAKTATASVPAVLLVIYWWKRGRVTWRDVRPTLPFFAIGAGLCGVTVVMENALATHGQGAAASPIDRVLIAGRALWFYAGKLAWPNGLVWFYPRWVIDRHIWWQCSFPAAALGVFASLWMARKSLGRGPLAAVLIFAGVLVPVLGFFDVFMFRYTFVADHLQYHASIALIALAVSAAALIAIRLQPARWFAPAAAVALLLPLSLLAHHRTYVWKDNTSVWQDAAATDPYSWMAHRSLAFHFENQGNYDQALAYFRKAIAIREEQLRANPTVSQYAEDLAASFVDMGALQHDFGRPAEAEPSFRHALAIRRPLVHDHPDVAEYREGLARCYICLAAAQQKTGQGEEAIVSRQEAISIRVRLARDYPAISRFENDLAASYLDLATLERALGRLAEADSACRKAIEIRARLVSKNPTLAEYRAVLATCYEEHAQLRLESGRPDDALVARHKAIEARQQLLDDKDSLTVAKHMTLIEVRQQLAQDTVALRRFQNDLAASYVDLGLLERRMGRPAEAQIAFRKAIEIRQGLVRDDPLAAEYQDGLAWCYVDLALAERDGGATREALHWHRKALELRDQLARQSPAHAQYQHNLATSYVDVALLQRELGHPAEAQSALGKAIAIRETLLREHPASSQYREGLAWCYVYLVAVQYEAGQFADARRWCLKAIELREKLVQDNPSANDYQRQLALSFRDLGNLQRAAGQIRDASTSYQRAIDIRQQLHGPSVGANERSQLAGDLALAADAQALLGQWSHSAELYAQAVQSGDTSRPTLEQLALVQLAAGDDAGYRATCADLIERHAGSAPPEAALAMALVMVAGPQAIADTKGVLELAQRAADAEDANPTAQILLGAAEYRAGHISESIGTLSDALAKLATDSSSTGERVLIGKLVGEMIIARVYREQKEQDACARHVDALRKQIGQADVTQSRQADSLPEWFARAAIEIAKHELAKLDGTTDAAPPGR